MRYSKRVMIAAVAAAAMGCNGGSAGVADAGTDTGLDTDTSWDGGPLTACDGEPPYEDMVCVPGGRYLMGCMPYDTDCDAHEKPMVEVTLSPFWIDRYEATYAQVLDWMNGYYSEEDPGFLKGMYGLYVNKPEEYYPPLWEASVVDIGLNDAGVFDIQMDNGPENSCGSFGPDYAAGGFAWRGAVEFCRRRGLRLPTEAEWEAAARGQTKWIYPCSWYHLTCWYGAYAQCRPQIYPEGECNQYDSWDCCAPEKDSPGNGCESQWGARQMYGNAAEYVLDHNAERSTTPDTQWGDHSWCANGCQDPRPRNGEVGVMKGGSVGQGRHYTRISSRDAGDYDTTFSWTGVRCVSSPVEHVLPDGGVDWAK